MSSSPPLVVADRYRLVAPLGQGGMGRVWRATDVVLHRDVAIKELVPPPGLTAGERQEMRERSLREARAIARLNNINVVRVFDVLRTDADPWIVMEYVASRSLQDTLASDGPFSPVRAAEIGLGVLNALRAAHRAGVVHRDVKPGNVLLGAEGRVVLTDFGLATVPGDPNVTRTGLVLGSPAYIAPERARDGTAGPAADLWSLGATLYAAVEGSSPFARPSAIATLAALATENPPPARNAGPLKPVLNGLLRKDPAHRINADEAERLLLRALGRKSKVTFPMSPTMRRPGAGRERSALTGPTAAAAAPVVPGPRPPVVPQHPVSPPGPAPLSGGRAASGDGRPVYAPGKASVGRPAAETPTRVDAPRVDATRVDAPPVTDKTPKPFGTRQGPPPAQGAGPAAAATDATTIVPPPAAPGSPGRAAGRPPRPSASPTAPAASPAAPAASPTAPASPAAPAASPSSPAPGSPATASTGRNAAVSKGVSSQEEAAHPGKPGVAGGQAPAQVGVGKDGADARGAHAAGEDDAVRGSAAADEAAGTDPTKTETAASTASSTPEVSSADTAARAKSETLTKAETPAQTETTASPGGPISAAASGGPDRAGSVPAQSARPTSKPAPAGATEVSSAEASVSGAGVSSAEAVVPGTEALRRETAVPGTEALPGETAVPGTEALPGETAVPGTEALPRETAVPAARTEARAKSTGSGPTSTGKAPADQESDGGAPTSPASGSIGDVPAFPGLPARPAWQPMPADRAQPIRGITIFGTRLTYGQAAIGAIVLLVLLVLLVTLVTQAVSKDDKPGPAAKNTPSPVATVSPSAPASTVPSQQPSSAPPTSAAPSTPPPSSPPAGQITLPAGWKWYSARTRGHSPGFTIPVPKNASVGSWGGGEVQLRWNNRLLIMASTDQPKSDPVKDWREQEKHRDYRGYRLVKIVPVNYFKAGADWEFYYTTNNGNAQHANKRNVVVSKKAAYSLNWYTTPEDWGAAQKDIQLIYQGFKPQP